MLPRNFLSKRENRHKRVGSAGLSLFVISVLLCLLPACAGKMSPSPAPTFSPTLPSPPGRPLPSATLPPPPPTPTVWPDDPARWQTYPSLNDVRSLAFAPDGALWAAIIGGVVRWDLATDTFIYYGVADGLLSEIVYRVVVADDGEVWAASSRGVSRFDGVSWTTYTRADGLPADVTYALALAPDGAIWAGTEGGLARFDGTWTSYTTADGLPDALVWSVGVDAAGVVWASTHGGGVARYDPQRDAWTTHNSFPYPNARVLAVAPDGAPWLHIGYDNVYRFDGEAWQVGYETNGQWVCDIAFATGGTPWLATCGGLHAGGVGLAHAEGDTWRYVTTADGLPDNTVTAVALSPTGVVAAGTAQGVSVYVDGRWRTLRRGPTLRAVTTVASGAGAVWFGYGNNDFHAAGGGVTRFDGVNWQYLTYPPNFPVSDNARVLAFAPDGALWAGGGCGVARFDGTTWTPVVTCDALSGDVLAIAFDSQDAVWIATYFALSRLADGELTSYPGWTATAMAVGPDDAVWVGLSPIVGGGLAHFDGATWTTDTEKFPLDYVAALVVDEDGALWAGGAPGIARFDGATWTHFTEVDGLSLGGTVALAFAPDGVLWAATSQAVMHFDGEAWRLAAASGDAAINAFSFAPDGSLWLGTSKGTVHFRP